MHAVLIGLEFAMRDLAASVLIELDWDVSIADADLTDHLPDLCVLSADGIRPDLQAAVIAGIRDHAPGAALLGVGRGSRPRRDMDIDGWLQTPFDTDAFIDAVANVLLAHR